jgi:MFS transporter, DHA2 family, glioxin efflux transporter
MEEKASVCRCTGAACRLVFARSLILSYVSLLIVGSVVSAAATVSIVFIIGRAIAGTGAAGVITGAMRTITLAAPRERRTFLEAFGAIIIGIVTFTHWKFTINNNWILGVCSVSGPLLGGVIAQNIGWRWSFWINAPIAALSIGIIVALFPVDNLSYAEVPIFQKIKLLDVFGGVVLVTSLTCLICGLQIASESEWLSLRVVALLSLAAFFLAVFLLHESIAGETTLFPRRLLRFRLVWIPCVGLFFLFAGFIHHVFFLSIYFQVSSEGLALLVGTNNWLVNSRLFAAGKCYPAATIYSEYEPHCYGYCPLSY